MTMTMFEYVYGETMTGAKYVSLFKGDEYMDTLFYKAPPHSTKLEGVLEHLKARNGIAHMVEGKWTEVRENSVMESDNDGRI